MSDPFIGEIKMFGGNFAPRGWALCNGSLIPITSNEALFSILGTTYGGDGRTSFGLPDLRGRVSMHPGSGPGLTTRRLGEKGGTETVTLDTDQMPAHGHTVNCTSDAGDTADPANNIPAASKNVDDIYSNAAANATMRNNVIASAGGNQGHPNVQPFQCVNYIIALVGVYPSRS